MSNKHIFLVLILYKIRHVHILRYFQLQRSNIYGEIILLFIRKSKKLEILASEVHPSSVGINDMFLKIVPLYRNHNNSLFHLKNISAQFILHTKIECAYIVIVVQSLSCVQLLCDPVDCSPPSSSDHGSFQAVTLEWVAISFSRVSSQSRD